MDCDKFSDFQTMTVYMSKLRKMSSNFFTEVLKSFDITHRHAAYITLLSKSGGMTMKQLSDSLCVDPANTTRVIAALKEKGLVDDDCKKPGGRKFNVFLTDEGKRIAAQLKESLINSQEYMLSALTDEERRQFFTLCAKIIKSSVKDCIDKKED